MILENTKPFPFRPTLSEAFFGRNGTWKKERTGKREKRVMENPGLGWNDNKFHEQKGFSALSRQSFSDRNDLCSRQAEKSAVKPKKNSPAWRGYLH
jgi:hypothetical protein